MENQNNNNQQPPAGPVKTESYLLQYVVPGGFLLSVKYYRNAQGIYDKFALQAYNTTTPEVFFETDDLLEFVAWLNDVVNRYVRLPKTPPPPIKVVSDETPAAE